MRTRVPDDVKLWGEAGALLDPLAHAHLLLMRRLEAEVVWEHCVLIAPRQPGHHESHLDHVVYFAQSLMDTRQAISGRES